jgi:DNA-binding XRE family transcriptional regulator
MAKPKKKTNATARKPTSDAVQILHRRYVESDAEMARMIAEELGNLQIARKIYDLRAKAGLSQRALAKLVGTTASAICRLEDADYDRHSLAMLTRIAAALNKRVEIRFVAQRSTTLHA